MILPCFFSQSDDDYDLVCNTVGNKDASEQRIRLAASGYDIWKSNPLNAEGGDPGKRKQIFEINCRYIHLANSFSKQLGF